MGSKWPFIAGLAVGYVLGARAGRERYEQLLGAMQKIRSNPTVQEAAGVVQAQTTRLVSSGTDAVRAKVGDSRLGNSRIGQRLLGDRKDVMVEERHGVNPPSHF